MVYVLSNQNAALVINPTGNFRRGKGKQRHHNPTFPWLNPFGIPRHPLIQIDKDATTPNPIPHKSGRALYGGCVGLPNL